MSLWQSLLPKQQFEQRLNIFKADRAFENLLLVDRNMGVRLQLD